ncbi:MAG: T9SS type A sorting domain-containing protein [Bacteroidota bacterium]
MKILIPLIFIISFANILFAQTPNPPNIIADPGFNLTWSTHRNGAGYIDSMTTYFYVKNSGGPGEISFIDTVVDIAWPDTVCIFIENKHFTVQGDARYIIMTSFSAETRTSSSPGPNLIVSATFPGSPGITLTNRYETAHQIPMNPFSPYVSYVANGTPSSTLSLVTGVEDNLTQIPTRYALEQNYPNPFNPSTTISFSLPSKGFVSLKVFDLIGREVATIVSETMPVGSYSKYWNAFNLSSGLYFYRLQVGTFTATKKMTLLK